MSLVIPQLQISLQSPRQEIGLAAKVRRYEILFCLVMNDFMDDVDSIICIMYCRAMSLRKEAELEKLQSTYGSLTDIVQVEVVYVERRLMAIWVMYVPQSSGNIGNRTLLL